MTDGVLFIREAEGTQGGSNDQTEIQGGDGVHGLVAVGETLQEGHILVKKLGIGHIHLTTEQETEEEEAQ